MTAARQVSFDRTEFAGKRALVTGGTQGMGAAIVRRERRRVPPSVSSERKGDATLFRGHL